MRRGPGDEVVHRRLITPLNVASNNQPPLTVANSIEAIGQLRIGLNGLDEGVHLLLHRPEDGVLGSVADLHIVYVDAGEVLRDPLGDVGHDGS